ncbi:unnamed protein product [Rhizoctonia solani]|uniref:BTB domain-containing protein n=1 Tax=Rhizoctonia solani TaxID=456999 RepID=A0A8H3BMF3_9AGAM|nr:unnamed protein product [Rhizoctonia solani]
MDMSERRKTTGSVSDRLNLEIGHVIIKKSSQPGSSLVYSPGFGPSDGGDTLVRSSDDVRFMVRFPVLESSFPRLLGNPPGPPSIIVPIDFPYSSDVLLLILKFISNQPFQPRRNECTNSFVTDCFEAADRYKLFSLTAWLRSQLVLSDSAIYLGIGAISAYGLCSMYQFRPEKQQAFRNCIGQINLEDESAVDTISRKCPNYQSALELVGRLARRSMIIAQVFSSFHIYPLDSRSSYWDKHHPAVYNDLTCKACRSETIFQVPSWLTFWAHRAKKELLMTPGGDCDHVFRVEFLGRRWTGFEIFGAEDEVREAGRLDDEYNMCQDCLKRNLLDNPSFWEDWAAVVQSELKEKLADEF